MSGETEKARPWKDNSGTEWHVHRRDARLGLEGGWILRRVGYSFVAWAESPELPSTRQLQAWVESHAARGPSDGTTARLWRDPRNNTEWEVFVEDRDLVFQRGIEAFRLTRDRTALPPRSMDDSELMAALDRAQGRE